MNSKRENLILLRIMFTKIIKLIKLNTPTIILNELNKTKQ